MCGDLFMFVRAPQPSQTPLCLLCGPHTCSSHSFVTTPPVSTIGILEDYHIIVRPTRDSIGNMISDKTVLSQLHSAPVDKSQLHSVPVEKSSVDLWSVWNITRLTVRLQVESVWTPELGMNLKTRDISVCICFEQSCIIRWELQSRDMGGDARSVNESIVEVNGKSDSR